MEVLIQMAYVIVVIAVLVPLIVEGLKRVIKNYVDGKYNSKIYPALSLIISIYLATGARAAISKALNFEWFYTSVEIWVLTGIIASLGAKTVYKLVSKAWQKTLEDGVEKE